VVKKHSITSGWRRINSANSTLAVFECRASDTWVKTVSPIPAFFGSRMAV
jgi:hypothetical protein